MKTVLKNILDVLKALVYLQYGVITDEYLEYNGLSYMIPKL
tara:strand:- start:3285 stop:3407 length:123 start_codon:yes stop_codon:yes gene_type:complete